MMTRERYATVVRLKVLERVRKLHDEIAEPVVCLGNELAARRRGSRSHRFPPGGKKVYITLLRIGNMNCI